MTDLPLAGRKILVTRARHQAGQLSEKLRALGAEVVEIPAIEIVPPESWDDLDRTIGNVSQYQWLIVTSANGVQALRDRMQARAVGLDAFSRIQVAAVGPATGRALRDLGFEITVTPAEYVAESLLEALGDRVAGQRVLLVRAAVARDVIPGVLRARGAEVSVMDAYRTMIPEESVAVVRTIFAGDGQAADAATFTSSSTVTNFLNLLRTAGVQPPARMRAVSIGPITSATLREHAWEPAAEADPHDLSGLVAAVVNALAR